MQTHQLKQVHKNKKSVQVGRGGTRGKTSGRGTKGQKARAGRKLRPEMRDIIKKLPKRRGRGKNIFRSIQTKPVVINLEVIEKAFKDGERITPAVLVKKEVIELYKGRYPKVKVLGAGELKKAIHFSGLAVSAGTKEKIEKAGGSVK